MASDNTSSGSGSEQRPPDRSTKSPDWADGLKQLYDAVVDEPLPDNFKDLLAKFDAEDPDESAADKGGSA